MVYISAMFCYLCYRGKTWIICSTDIWTGTSGRPLTMPIKEEVILLGRTLNRTHCRQAHKLSKATKRYLLREELLRSLHPREKLSILTVTTFLVFMSTSTYDTGVCLQVFLTLLMFFEIGTEPTQRLPPAAPRLSKLMPSASQRRRLDPAVETQ